METIKSLVALGIVLLPASALAQGTAQRAGTVRAITDSRNHDDATVRDYGGWIEWRATSTGTRTQYLPPCTSGLNGSMITVIDGKDNAGANPIVIMVRNDGSQVGGATNGVSIETNGGSYQLVCDGINNWIAVGLLARGSPFRESFDQQLMNVGNGTNVWEDTIRGTDNGGVVVYHANHVVDVDLPQSTEHGAFPNSGGFSVLIKNNGTALVRVRPKAPSNIDGVTTFITIPVGDGRFLESNPSGSYVSFQMAHSPLVGPNDRLGEDK